MEDMRWRPFAAMLLFLAAALLAKAQSTRPADLAAGKLLVASPDLPDPNFAKTVILLVQYDEDGVVGLILNRRSKVPVSRVLNELAGARNRPDPVYAGGPVGRNDVLALVRAPGERGDAKRVLPDIYLVSTRAAMEKAFAAVAGADTLHVYLGYSGWTEAQLENELDLGAWYIFQGNAKTVFDADPDGLWDRFIRETELRIASRGLGRGLRLRAAGGVLPRPD